MKKVIAWLKSSNRWKHLLGGLLVGACSGSGYGALYAAAIAASCLEYKDKAHGCAWDWVDWILTLAGGAVAAAAYTLAGL